MNSIRVLSSRLADQIAAGEVIERPASVVKELVENAIDAHSTQIDVSVEEAGLRKIEVRDNGDGIPPEEAGKAFQRHATSKLQYDEDLFRIRTLGFRGEALPSIASVSELTLETSTGEGEGKHISLKGGAVEEEKPAASRKGTTVTVENLFFNTPARLKYIKTLKTELANITDILNRFALAHPHIAFRLVHDGNQMIRTVGNGDLRQAIAGVYGVETAKKMRAVSSENLDFRVSGYVSLPEVTRASRNYMTLIVNGRFIRNMALSRAIETGYGSKLMIGRHPVAVVNIEMDPLLLDVNVHPTKQEIRISREDELGQLIKQAINTRMNKEQRIPHALENMNSAKKQPAPKYEQTKIDFREPSVSEDKPYTPDSFVGNRTERYKSWQTESSVDPQGRRQDEDNGYVEQENQPPGNRVEEPFSSIERKPSLQAGAVPLNDQELAEEHVTESPLTTAQKLKKREEQAAGKPFPELEYIGQMHGTYLFAQNEEGLYIIDQHAAQERIKYEYYRSRIGEIGTAQQELLVPLVLEYTTSDCLIIQDHKETLEKAGLHLEGFGENAFLLRSHPSWFLPGQEEATAKEMIDFLLQKQSISVSDFREATAIMMSCKRSIKANHYLGDQQARALLVDLAKAANPYNCPHGRPVLVHFSTQDMEKMFKRIQDRN
ncbi:DNA mismatch repair endonuclease MutL [Atopococcus tabaci]|uniref:DNA mismatch repair endonuclease MutL n=1 Tax=Atopococcus tabaci TaxID=269774 RepID=UPI0004117ABE|nr:DNA mismatch repair endonuclease MutL [Atopococcus tabaci]